MAVQILELAIPCSGPVEPICLAKAWFDLALDAERAPDLSGFRLGLGPELERTGLHFPLFVRWST